MGLPTQNHNACMMAGVRKGWKGDGSTLAQQQVHPGLCQCSFIVFKYFIPLYLEELKAV